MRISYDKSLPSWSNGFFTLKNEDWLHKQRIAGKVAASALMILENKVKSKTTLSLLELNSMAEEYIQDHKCIPTFKNYKGHGLTLFPAGVCISVNKQLVHGIPTNYYLQEGDVVSFDLGATYEGAIADTALTCIYGEPKKQDHVKLIKATEEALMKGIQAISVGKKLGSIGHAIFRSAKGNGFNVITQYGGHGIDISSDGSGIPHAPPFVANKDDPETGFRMQPGLVLAIEPMLIIGSTETHLHGDGWTVCGMGISAHFEHTVFLHEDHVEIITDRKYNVKND
jgi:methionyl aminopeptidase